MVSVNANKVANTTSRCYNDQRANKNNRRVKENYQKKKKKRWKLGSYNHNRPNQKLFFILSI